MATTNPTRPQPARPRPSRPTDVAVTPRDSGYTLVELLLVVTILAVLGSVVWLGVTGMTTQAADTGCRADRYQLHVAAEAFFAQTRADEIAPTGTDSDRFERTLVQQGFLARTSTYHDLTATGAVTPEDPSC